MTHPDFNQLDKLEEIRKDLLEEQEIAWLLETACRILNVNAEINKILERLKV